MAVNNINPSGPGGPIKRDQKPAKITSDNTAKPIDAEETTKKAPEAVRSEQVQSDTLQISQDRRFVEEMVNTVEKMEDTPREDVVKMASERVRNGDYNSGKFMENLALKLINTES
ncbi:hypothetical protein ACFL2X_00475 [Candidatus Latescibacterota bacterium]